MKKSLYTILFALLAFASGQVMAQSQTNLDQAMRYIETNAEKWGLQESDYSGTQVTDMYTNNKSGITYIYLTQAYNNVPVNNAITSIAITPQGKLFASSHNYIPNIKEKISSTTPSVTPLAAIKASAAHLGLQAESMPTLMRTLSDKNLYQFSQASFSENEIDVKLMYVKDGNDVKLAWSLAINEIEGPDCYNTFVDANTGDIISKYNQTTKCTIHKGKYDKHVGCSHETKKSPSASIAEANAVLTAASGSYNVFALPTESPIHGERTMLVDPHFPDSSPFGWHDTNGIDGAEETITRGNNVHAFLDKDNSGFSDGDEPDGGQSLAFDYPYDISDQADTNEDAATVNLFYTVNMLHDITKRLGFDEQSGNFQINNYGNGGVGTDHVLAQASDGIGLATPTLNNANFLTPSDGGNGEMQMYLWENPSGILAIDEPAELAGFVNPVGTAENVTIPFGGFIPLESENPIVGKVVLANDGSPSNPTTCCNPVVNEDEINGNIALIDRGLCDFSLKAYNAQQAGAISVLICNVVGAGGDGEEVIGMNGGQNAADVTIVPLFLRKSDCDRIRASILSDIDVTISIQNRPPMGPTYLDGSFDNGIIAHEYGHGISNRLVGGPSQAGCLTSGEQPGEGISDYFSLILTVEDGDTDTDPRGIGNYADGQSITGRGIRTAPYSTDFAINDLTYDDIKTAGSIYDVGEVWVMALWEMYWALVNEYGLDTSWDDENAGNYKAAKLVIEGMKISGCNPSLLDLRDGIMNADSMCYNGENGALLWTAFAKRGFGYLATDGGSSELTTDGDENFDVPPLIIRKLKVQKDVTTLVSTGEQITVTLNAQNHTGEARTNVTITDFLPDGMSYVDGSASMPATFDNGELTISLGDMEYLEEASVTYNATVNTGISSETLFYDDVDNADFGEYNFNSVEGFNLWVQSFDIANSGVVSWYASQPDTEVETDFFMDIPVLSVVGDRPVLRFYSRWDTETGVDGGFIQVSKDGGLIFEDVKDKFIRNGYPLAIDYSTFAIPSLEGFTGSSDGEFVDSYLDLSDYKGNDVIVRFRFGTNETVGTGGLAPGWFVDDLELMDMNSLSTYACISSDEDDEECTPPTEIIVQPGDDTGTVEQELDGFEIGIAPNPASEYVTISVKAQGNTPALLTLSTVDGKMIKAQNIIVSENQKVRTFDLSDVAAGIYLVQVRTETGISTRKIIKQ